MTEPQDPATAGGDRLRAGHADREQVIETLKNAFMQGRLTGEELGARTGQVLAARTYAELAAVTADIPGAPRLDGSSALARAEVASPSALARAEVPGPSGLARRWPLARASVKSGGFLVIAAVVVQSGNIIANGDYGPATASYQGWIRVLNVLALALVVTAVVILGRGVAASVKQRRSRKQLRPGPGDHTLETGRHDGAGQDVVPPGRRADQTRADQTRADLRTRISWPHRSPSSGRGAPVPSGIRPVPDAL
jgi:Domain of unknown function (DUF1707)